MVFPMEIFRKRLRNRSDWAKKNLGLTQEEQAEKVGVSRARFRGWFKAGREPSIALQAKICEVLETHPNWLFGFDADPVPPLKREPDLHRRVDELLKRLNPPST